MSHEQHQQKFQELQQKTQKVIESAIKLNAQIEGAQENYQRLEEIGLKKYQTTDLEELKATATRWYQQNEERLLKAQERVQSVAQETEDKGRIIKQVQQL